MITRKAWVTITYNVAETGATTGAFLGLGAGGAVWVAGFGAKLQPLSEALLEEMREAAGAGHCSLWTERHASDAQPAEERFELSLDGCMAAVLKAADFERRHST